jgi:hypothetical protein
VLKDIPTDLAVGDYCDSAIEDWGDCIRAAEVRLRRSYGRLGMRDLQFDAGG